MKKFLMAVVLISAGIFCSKAQDVIQETNVLKVTKKFIVVHDATNLALNGSDVGSFIEETLTGPETYFRTFSEEEKGEGKKPQRIFRIYTDGNYQLCVDNEKKTLYAIENPTYAHEWKIIPNGNSVYFYNISAKVYITVKDSKLVTSKSSAGSEWHLIRVN
jgi:hypothetical protein